MFNFKKPKSTTAKRNLRAGGGDEDEDGDREASVQAGQDALVGGSSSGGGVESAVRRRGKTSARKEVKPRSKISFGDEEDAGGEDFKLQKSAAPSAWILDGSTTALSGASSGIGAKYDSDHLEELRKSNSAPPPSRQRQGNVAGDSMEEDVETSIPDAASIYAARQLREQKRAGKAKVQDVDDSGFISLRNPTASGKAAKESRLIREDEGEEEVEHFEDYEGEKIAFTAKSAKERKFERQKEIEATLLANEQWDEYSEGRDMDEDEDDAGNQSTGIFGLAAPAMIEGPRVQDVSMPTGAVLPTLTGVANRLKGMLFNNDESVKTLRQRDTDIAVEAITAAEASESLTRDTEVSGDRYNFFQDLRMYLNSLADFFDEKLPQIVALEDDYGAFVANAAEQRKRTRYGALDSDYTLLTGLVPNRTEPDPVLEDEAGREGVLEQMVLRHRHMFDDSLDAYSSLGSIRDSLIEWKMRYPVDYERAFGSLSIPGAFELAIRYELWDWFPFLKLIRFDEMEWHQIVGSFDTGPVADEEESPELEVLSTMVKSICLPRLKARLPLYDPFVPQQTRDLLAIVSDLRDYVASDSPAFKGLTAIVQNLLEMWIAEFADRYGSESPHVPVAADAKPDGPLEARTRLVGAFRPMLESIVAWRRYLGSAATTGLATSFLSRVMLPCLSNVTNHTLQQDIDTLKMVTALLQPYGSEEEQTLVKHTLRKWTFKLRLLSSAHPSYLETIDSLELL